MKIPNIRFNLKFYTREGEEITIRTYDDLVENLNLSELWDYYQAGILVRWLRSIGKVSMADAILTISDDEVIEKRVGDVLDALELDVDSKTKDAFAELLSVQQEMSRFGGTQCESLDELRVQLFRTQETSTLERVLEKIIASNADFFWKNRLYEENPLTIPILYRHDEWYIESADVCPSIKFVPQTKFFADNRTSRWDAGWEVLTGWIMKVDDKIIDLPANCKEYQEESVNGKRILACYDGYLLADAKQSVEMVKKRIYLCLV